MRAIDADALKRRAQKVATESWKMKIEAKVETVLNQFIDWIDEAPTIQAEPHWIPVTERLPEVNGCYLVSVKNDHERRYSKTAWFEKGVWFARQDVVAWMPLPEPMRMEKQ
jgi:hypothetical protein